MQLKDLKEISNQADRLKKKETKLVDIKQINKSNVMIINQIQASIIVQDLYFQCFLLSNGNSSLTSQFGLFLTTGCFVCASCEVRPSLLSYQTRVLFTYYYPSYMKFYRYDSCEDDSSKINQPTKVSTCFNFYFIWFFTYSNSDMTRFAFCLFLEELAKDFIDFVYFVYFIKLCLSLDLQWVRSYSFFSLFNQIFLRSSNIQLLSIFCILQIFNIYFLKISKKAFMYKGKSPFAPPNPQFIDRSRKRTGMSIQEQKPAKNCVSVQKTIQANEKPTPVQTVQTLSVSNNLQSSPAMLEQKFCFDIAVPDQNDTGLYWQYALTNQVSNEYSRKLILRQLQYYVRNADANGIVNSIRLQIQQVPGYLSSTGVQGNIIAILNLAAQTATIDDLNMKSYDLIYKQTQDVVWDIPMNLSTLKLRVYLDQTPLTGQISPLTLQFDIRHFGR